MMLKRGKIQALDVIASDSELIRRSGPADLLLTRRTSRVQLVRPDAWNEKKIGMSCHSTRNILHRSTNGHQAFNITK